MDPCRMDIDDKEPNIDVKIGFILDACPQISFEEAKKCLEAWNGNVTLAIDDKLGVLGFTIDSSKPNSSALPCHSSTWKLKFIADIEDIDQRAMAEEIRDLLPNTAEWKIIKAIEFHKDGEDVKTRAVNMLMDEEAKTGVKIEKTDEGLPYSLDQNKLDFSTGDAGPSGTSREEKERDFAEKLHATGNSIGKSEQSSVRPTTVVMEITDSDEDNDEDSDMEDAYFSDIEAAQLQAIFPHVTYHECKNELNMTTPVRNMEEAIEALGERFAEENAQSSDAGIPGTNDKGKGKEKDVATKANGKRPGENLGYDIPEKRARTGSNEWIDEPSELEDASSWVRAFYDQNGQVKVILDQGEHPCRFPVPILRNLTFYADALTDAMNNVDPTITILNVRQEIFDMAMQWSMCKRVKTRKRATAPEYTDVLLEFIEFAQQAGLDINILDNASEILAQIKQLLLQYRYSLLDRQFRKVYEIFPLGHPLCDLFVNATIRPWIEFRYEDGREHRGDTSDSEPEGGWRSAAHKAAFGKKKFSLARLLIGEHAITKFQEDFFKAQQRCWFGRKKIDINLFTKRKPNFQIHVTDPLTGDIIVV